ncbi:geranylgeranyl diphosphate synthase, type I [Asanoa hainanensis]|uniref:Geranylgeranyl diphosphate synthase, type I n=1 Tax=Asanoa hainanensis TaxID=560556 RepID=A0A239MT02_9ACTN|nr:polyprenyl synthetase family protein [Asanoa hainanensis]SNT44979.1 geranylgeranyl diphosphate synthase, type I [Asanoa hainanensis]
MANDTLVERTRDVPCPPPQRSTPPNDGRLRAAVDTTLADFLRHESAILESTDAALRPLAALARDSVLAGGKRLRPTFAHWGWRGVAGPAPAVEPVLPAFAALELLHAFALIHDDVMDGSATRRGRPTAHQVLATQHAQAGRRGPAERFGTAGAVLVGDLCLVWADRLLSRADVPAPALLAARRCYDEMRVEAIAGQYLDVLGDAEPDSWSVDRALRVARLKTAGYTVTRPLLFGAALAGHGERAVAGRLERVTDAYQRYGAAVGEAFQLCDDLLGVFGDPAVTGKPAGDDLRTGKPTALLLLARRLATAAQAAELTRADSPDLRGIAEIVTDTGAVAAVEAMIDNRVDLALAALDGAPIDSTADAALRGLAVMATHRQS